MQVLNKIEPPKELEPFEEDVLRAINGEDGPGGVQWWGAGLTAAAEYLKGIGFVAGSYHITDEGRNYLRNLEKMRNLKR